MTLVRIPSKWKRLIFRPNSVWSKIIFFEGWGGPGCLRTGPIEKKCFSTFVVPCVREDLQCTGYSVYVKNQTKFFIYTLLAERTTFLNIRGLAQEIPEDLKAQRISNVFFVSPFVTMKAKIEGCRMSLWLESFENDDFTPINAINRTSIHFERIRNKQILQCQNC